MMYANRTGKSSLMNDEPAWADLEVSDVAGFFGFTACHDLGNFLGQLPIPRNGAWEDCSHASAGRCIAVMDALS